MAVRVVAGVRTADLVAALAESLAARTTGTLAAPAGIDWLCVSPKAAAPVVQKTGQELKLVYPQVEPEAQPDNFVDLEFEYFYLQPLDGPELERNTRLTVDYCLAHPRWRLSLQAHKIVGID